MLKIVKFFGCLILAYPAWGSGTTANLTVSSGTFQPVSMYSNDDGGNRQAIVIGDFTSSDTVRVDRITGMRVSLSTSALTTSGALLVVSTATTVSGTIAATQSGTWTVQPGNTQNTTSWLVKTTDTVNTSAAQSGTWTVQPGNTQNTTPWQTISTSTVITSTYPVNTNPYSETTIGDGFKLIPTAGTRVALASSTVSKRATVCSHASNTGVVAVGGTTVVAALASQQGVALNAGDCYSLSIDNLSDINVDTTISGSTATFTYQN